MVGGAYLRLGRLDYGDEKNPAEARVLADME